MRALLKIIVLLALVVLAPAGIAQAASPEGTFKGRYVCGAGPGGAVLTITERRGGRLAAVLRFFSLPSNPGIPSGSYTLTGRFVALTGEVTLIGRSWIVQPPGYAMANIKAVLSKDGRILAGRLTGANDCKSISLRRQS